MDWLRQFLFRLGALFRKRSLEADMAEEIQSHLAMEAAAAERAGVQPAEAHNAALRQFGNLASIQEQAREQRGLLWLDQGLQDFRYAIRQLRRNPGFAVLSALSLALGIGANTAIFSLVNEVFLKPLPVSSPTELVLFRWRAPVAGFKHPHPINGWSESDGGTNRQTSTSFSLLTFEWFRDQNQTLANVFAFAPLYELNITVDGQTEISNSGQVVSGEYYAGLGLRPFLGRFISPADDKLDAPPVAVISYRYWQRRFGGDPSILGRAIAVNHVPFTVIGVTPEEFSGTLQIGESPDVSLPLSRFAQLWPQIASFMAQPWRFWTFQIMGRLKPGVAREQVQGNLEGLFQQSAIDDKTEGPIPSATNVRPVDFPSLQVLPGSRGLYQMRRLYMQPMAILLSLAGAVMLIASANVANLLIARGAARRREITTRLALGASRGRIIRQLLMECVPVILLSVFAGVAFAYWGKDALVALHAFGQESQSLNLVLRPTLDFTVLGFSVLLAFATMVLFGLLPAWRSTHHCTGLELSGGTIGRKRSTIRLDKALMIIQVALSVILLIGAGLFTRTLQNLRDVDVGFNRHSLVLFRLDAAPAGYARTKDLEVSDVQKFFKQTVPSFLKHFANQKKVRGLTAQLWTTGRVTQDCRDELVAITSRTSPTHKYSILGEKDIEIPTAVKSLENLLNSIAGL